MTKKTHYAVRVGRKSNIIVRTWAECSDLVSGFAGAVYKGFTCFSDAERFLISKKPEWDKSKPKIHQPATEKKDKYGFFKPRYYMKNGVRHADYGKTFGTFDGKLYCGDEPPWVM